jgi:hypothetical protein
MRDSRGDWVVLNAMVPFANAVLRHKDYNYAVVSHELT